MCAAIQTWHNRLMNPVFKTAVVVLAAGSGTRFGHSTNKVWLPLDGRTIIARSLENAAKSFEGGRVILVINPDDEQLAQKVVAEEASTLNVEIVHGGASRHQSEFNALAYLAPSISAGDIHVVLIHDGARPLATAQLFAQIATSAYQYGGAIPTIALDPREMDTVHLETIVRVQTPQGFTATKLLQAYQMSLADNFVGTDTAACMENYFPEITTMSVQSDVSNIKITYPADLEIAAKLLLNK